MSQKKLLTVIVITYDMQREATRTLFALTPRYQLGINPAEYSVHVIDNGSPRPLGPGAVAAFGSNFRYTNFEATTPSPCMAINYGVESADTPYIMVLIDGARIPTPGMLKASLDAISLCGNPFIYSLGMHLGTKRQNESMLEGYDQGVEDKLLKSVAWRQNGYRLFDISVPGGSYRRGYTGKISESNCFCLRKVTFQALGGYDTRFVSPGGGLANLDFFNRAHQASDITPILLLGEATFHQYHGGVATNTPASDNTRRLAMAQESEKITGAPMRTNWRAPLYFGRVSTESASFFRPQPASKIDAPVLIVLGMYRSGSSCLAGMLQTAGFEAGITERWSPDNQRGNRENLRVVKLNDTLLRRNKADWDHPPAERLFVDDDLRETRGEILSDMAAAGRPCMFKDPRTLLTLPFWREAIPNPYRLGIFRHPIRVALSLYYRSQKPIREGLLLWLAYNRALLAEYDRVNFPIICFDLSPENFVDSIVAGLRQECGDLLKSASLDLTTMLEFYSAELVHQKTCEIDAAKVQDPHLGELITETMALYEILCAQAGITMQIREQTTPSVAATSFSKLLTADQAAQTGDTDRALMLYREALLCAGNQGAIWKRIISLLQNAGRMGELEKNCEEAVLACPTDGMIVFTLANIKKKTGNSAEAFNLIERALAVAPEWPTLWLRKGEWLCDAANWSLAVETLQQCIRLQPTETAGFWAYTKLAEAMICSGDRTNGEACFDRAIKMTPEKNQFRVYFRLAQALIFTGDVEGALQPQRIAAEMASNAPHIHIALANLLLRLGRETEALECLNRALTQGEDAISLRLLLTKVAMQLGLVDTAKAQLIEVENREPRNAELAKLKAAWGFTAIQSDYGPD